MANGMTPSTVEVDEPYVRVDRWGNRWAPRISAPLRRPGHAARGAGKVDQHHLRQADGTVWPFAGAFLPGACRHPHTIENSAGLTIALGTPEVTVLDHCTAYSTFANLGRRYDPVMIPEIKNRDGLTLHDYRRTTANPCPSKPCGQTWRMS